LDETVEYYLDLRKSDPKLLALFPTNDEANELNDRVQEVLGEGDIIVVDCVESARIPKKRGYVFQNEILF